jgi:hypothetical protein
MNPVISTNHPSTLQEWASFLNLLNGKTSPGAPLLKSSGASAERLVMHLEKQVPSPEPPAIFRRLGRHTQLVLQF